MSMNEGAIMEKPKKRTQAISGTFEVVAVSLEKELNEKGKTVTTFTNNEKVPSKDIISTDLKKGAVITAYNNTEKADLEKQENQSGETR